jgi:hypothetical protein
MTRTSRVVDWIIERPMVWRAALVAGALLLAAGMALGPLPLPVSFIAVAGLLGAAAMLTGSLHSRAPVELCFLAFVALMPATRFSLFEAGVSIQGNFAALIAAAGLLIWRAGWLKRPLWLPRSRVHGPVLALFAIILFSFFLSLQVSPGVYRGEVRYLRSAKQIAYFTFMVITYVTVLAVVRHPRIFKQTIWVYVGASTVVSLYGLYQFVAYPLGLPFLDLFPESASFGASRIWAISLAGGRFLRVWSVASEPVWFGDYLAGVIPLTAALALNGVLPRGHGRLALWGALGVMLLALLLTFTRSAYLALFVGAFVLVAARPGLLVRATAAAGLLLAVVLLASLIIAQLPSVDQASLVNAVADRFLSPFQDENFGNIHRTTAVAASWDMFLDRPWGVGYGNYGFFYYDYQPAWGRSITDTQPNAFPVMSGSIILRLLTETSIPGALAFVWLVAAVTIEGANARRRLAADRFMEAAATGLLAGFLTLMARLLMADSIHFTYQWFVIGMLVAAGRLSRQTNADAGSMGEAA